MLIVYQCYGSTHSSIVASYIHLGKIPSDKTPRISDIMGLPHFDRLQSSQIGSLNYIGTDSENNHVFALGSSSKGEEIKKILKEVLPVLHISTGDILVVDCLDQVNILSRLGGFISRQVGLVFVGRPLVAFGIWMCYKGLVEKVESLRKTPHYHALN